MFYTYKAILTRLIDGDTCLVSLDLGLHVWVHDLRIRLAHLDAPELSTAAGIVSRDYVAGLVGPLPAPVTVTTIRDRTDNYGRYLGVLTTATGIEVNQALLDSGHAVPWP